MRYFISRLPGVFIVLVGRFNPPPTTICYASACVGDESGAAPNTRRFSSGAYRTAAPARIPPHLLDGSSRFESFIHPHTQHCPRKHPQPTACPTRFIRVVTTLPWWHIPTFPAPRGASPAIWAPRPSHSSEHLRQDKARNPQQHLTMATTRLAAISIRPNTGTSDQHLPQQDPAQTSRASSQTGQSSLTANDPFVYILQPTATVKRYERRVKLGSWLDKPVVPALTTSFER